MAMKSVLILASVFMSNFHIRKPTSWASLSLHRSLACPFSQACQTGEISKLSGKKGCICNYFNKQKPKCMLIDIWLDVPCKAFDPPGMHKRSKRLLFLPIWGKLMHFLNSFSGFVFALLFSPHQDWCGFSWLY